MMDTIGIRYVFDIDKAVSAQKRFSAGFSTIGDRISSSSARLRLSARDYLLYAKYYSKFPKDGINEFYNYSVDKLNKLNALYKKFKGQENKGPPEKTIANPKKEGAGGGGGFGAFAVAKGMALYNAGVGLLQTGIATIKEQMPFISQGFEMAGKVISANLLYPLSKELMPLFFKFFKWIKENRIVFVQMGVLLVSVFRIVKSVVIGAFNLIKAGFNSAWKAIGGGEITMNRFMNYMNFLMLKVAFFFAFFQAMLEPLIKGIGTTIGWVWKEVIKPFIDGFVQGFVSNLIPTISELHFLIDELASAFSFLQTEGDVSWIAKTFQYVGKVIGYAVVTPTRTWIALVRLLVGIFKDPKKAIIDFGHTMYDIFIKHPFIEIFTQKFTNGFNWIRTKLSDFKNWISGIWQGIATTFSKYWDKITVKMNYFVDRIKNAFLPVSEFLNMIRGVLNSDKVSGDSSSSGESKNNGDDSISGENNSGINNSSTPRLRSKGQAGNNSINNNDNRTYNVNVSASDAPAAANAIGNVIQQPKLTADANGYNRSASKRN
ncbi:phage tail protein [Leptospira noguchii]|uniref:Uncharacterized protein n=1 Tax=Leptospira noguchii TaxID=28182 RepID=M6V939_9LEPT|nr:hypothetical protein [Leptospira noguchii]EMO53937.1 hypothetical protein LEP1GSC172_3332 [Leptospira noguchii]